MTIANCGNDTLYQPRGLESVMDSVTGIWYLFFSVISIKNQV